MQSSIASSSFLSYKVRQKLSESQSEKKSANQHCDFRRMEVVQNFEKVSLFLWIYIYDIFSKSPNAQSFFFCKEKLEAWLVKWYNYMVLLYKMHLETRGLLRMI